LNDTLESENYEIVEDTLELSEEKDSKGTGPSQNTFGLKIGTGIGSFGGSEATGYSSRFGVNIGVTFRFFIRDFLVIQPELLYSQKNGAFYTSFFSIPLDYSYTIGYLEIPVLCKYRLMMLYDLLPFIYIGPVFSANLNASIKAEIEDIEEKGVIKDLVNESNYGIVIGGGLEILLNNVSYTLEVKYDIGLKSVFVVDGDNKDIYHRVINFIFGINI
jgi:hypothetical protein